MNPAAGESKIVNWGGYLALTLLVCLIISVFTVRAGLWQQGLMLYALCCAGAAALMLVFIISMALPAFAQRRGALLKRSLLILPGCLLLTGILSAGKYPEIHDITTDSMDPPQFEQAVKLRNSAENSLEINHEVLQKQATAYPDIKTMHSHLSTGQAFSQASTVAEHMGWEITRSDPKAGTIEAVDTTAMMGFKDDIVIRVRSAEADSLIDLRSASRVGRSDLGANAKRIREFMARFKS